MMIDSIFCLQFDPTEMSALAGRYKDEKENGAFEAGSQIRAGAYTRAHLGTIFEWKTNGRGKSRLLENTDDEIADALNLAVTAKTERAALAVLCGLHGVDVPVASAILTAIYPERYTVIDFRALEALGIKKTNLTVNFYLDYLADCRKRAKAQTIELRELDRALWQWSKEAKDQTT